ncbi:MAG: TetR family transcriptional regulator [Dehalobacterium sp.]
MKKAKINQRKINANETKKKIYETAHQLFKEYGFENVSVDSIVEMAGVSKGTFYVHFDSKDALIVSLINDYVNEVDLDYKSHIESFPAETATSDIIISLVGKIADIITGTIGHKNMKNLYKAQITKTINTDSVISYNRELYKIFSNILSKGIVQGEFKTQLPVDTLTKHCIIALRGLTYEWCIRYPDFELKEQAVKHFQVLLNGII